MAEQRDVVYAYKYILENMSDVAERLNKLELVSSAEESYSTLMERAKRFWGMLKRDIGKLSDLEPGDKAATNRKTMRVTRDLMGDIYNFSVDIKMFELDIHNDRHFQFALLLRHTALHGHKNVPAYYMKLQQGKTFEWMMGIDLAYVIRDLGQTATRLWPSNYELFLEYVDEGNEYFNLSKLLGDALSSLEKGYKVITAALAVEAEAAKDYLSNTDIPEGVPSATHEAIRLCIERDSDRVRLAKANLRLPPVMAGWGQ